MNIRCVNCGGASLALYVCPKCGKNKKVREEAKRVEQVAPATQSEDYSYLTNPLHPLSPFYPAYHSTPTETRAPDPEPVRGHGGSFDGGGASSSWDSSPSSTESSSYSSSYDSSSSSYDSSSSSSYDSGSSSSSDY